MSDKAILFTVSQSSLTYHENLTNHFDVRSLLRRSGIEHISVMNSRLHKQSELNILVDFEDAEFISNLVAEYVQSSIYILDNDSISIKYLDSGVVEPIGSLIPVSHSKAMEVGNYLWVICDNVHFVSKYSLTE